MFNSFFISQINLLFPTLRALRRCVTVVRYAVGDDMRKAGALRCVTVRYGGALRSCVTMVRYAVVTTCVTLVRYGALWWCVTLSATTRVMLIRYDSALHCHATIEMVNSLMHKSFFCFSNEACVIMWVMACG